MLTVQMLSLIPRILPPFQCSQEKWECLACNSTWVTFHLEPTWNGPNYVREWTLFLGLPTIISSLVCVFRLLEVRFDYKARSVNKSESYQQFFQLKPRGWDDHVPSHTRPSHFSCELSKGGSGLGTRLANAYIVKWWQSTSGNPPPPQT